MSMNMESLFTTFMSCVTVGNILLAVLFVLIVKQLTELYELRGMPPGPRFTSLPFLGNVLSMNSNGATTYENTQSLRKSYGGLFTMKLGSWRTVFVSSPESIKEVLVTNSKDFAGRLPFHTMSLFSFGGKSIVLGDYGPAWKFHRKMFVTALRQYISDIPLIQERIVKQALGLLQSFDKQNGKAFDTRSMLHSSIANVISEITFGENYDITHPAVKKMVDFSNVVLEKKKLFSQTLFLDLFPIFKHLPFGPYKKVEEVVNTWMRYPSQEILRDIEAKFNPDEPVTNLTQALLKSRNEAKFENVEDKSSLLHEDYLLGTINDMFQAGYATSAITLYWIIAFLVNYPHYQEELQQQIDEVVGRDRRPDLEDRPNLPLVHAFIMESQRLSNVADLTIPHSARKDTTVCGYRIPKDTLLMVDLAALHLNPSCWENPDEFNPYRHIDNDGKLITNQNWLPFSAGRRICAGEPLAKIELFLFFTIMIHEYTFLPEEGKCPPSLKGEKVNVHSPKPYKIRVVKRK